jgi:DNA (cytosine-5)-methyltransferase 1
LYVLDLFSGIGGFSLGLERAGFETAAFCEVLPKPRHLLAHHWPTVPIYDDVRTLTAERLAADGIAVDAICGGFPCQDISLAGKGAGIEGERSGLWREYARLVGELRPCLVFVENVSALLGRGLGAVLADLAALGYHAWWDCIPASAVGAPHRRDRLWLVAYPGGLEHQGFGDALRRAVAAELSRSFAANVGHTGRAARERNPRGVLGAQAKVSRKDGPKHGDRAFRPEYAGAGARTGLWLSEPNVGRVAHGVPARVDRLHGLGNAVVPEIPYRLGKASLTALAECDLRAAA